MRVNENFVLRKLYGKAILMPVRRNEVGDDPIFLNTVACQIWEAAADHLVFEQIISNLKTMYSFENNSMEEIAVKQFIMELLEMGLIYDD